MSKLQEITQYLRSQEGRLAITYWLIIAVLTFVFSSMIFGIAVSKFDHPRRPSAPAYRGSETIVILDEPFGAMDARMAAEARADLFASIVLFNIIIDATGAIVSYYLARNTMKPINRAISAQTRFVSDASHELRTPLTAMQTTNEVALRNPKLTIIEARQVLEQNIVDVTKLRELTSALLSLARDSGSFEMREFNLQDAVADAMQPIVTIAIDKSIEIEDQVHPTMIMGSQAAVSQILRILLENAVKYSPERSKVTVYNSVKGGICTVRVRDEGIGIAPEDRQHVFERFYRTDSSRSTSRVEGFGLGLSIAKNLADKHGSKLVIESSKKGKGTVFALSLAAQKSRIRKDKATSKK